MLRTKGEVLTTSFSQPQKSSRIIFAGRDEPQSFKFQEAALIQSQLISVILPVLNEETQIAATLTALASECDIEIIVADGGSRDRTGEISAGFAAVRVVNCDKANRGLQMNQGAQVATGETLLFLHADATLPPDALSAIRHALKDDKILGGCFQIRFPEVVPASLHLVARGINFRTRLFRTATGDQAIFIHRRAFDEIGGYKILPLMEDIALFNEMKRRGRVAVLEGKVEISPRRWLTHGIWRTVLLMYLLRLGFWLGIHPATLKRFFIDVR